MICLVERLVFLGLMVAMATVAPAQKLSRPELKCLTVPMYFPGAGILFNNFVAEQTDYLNPAMLRMEFIGDPPANAINYAAYDYVIGQAGERGLEILGLIDYASINWSNRSEWATQDFRDRFTARVEEIVTRYHDAPHPIRHWEIWNEPDIQEPTFNVRIDPQPYALLLIQSYEAIKAIDPGATVVLGGVSPKGLYYEENYLDDLYRTTAMQDYYTTNGHYPFDVVAVHPYPEIFSNPNPMLGVVLNNLVKAVMNDHGDAEKKVWLTEMGWSSFFVSEAQQAQYLRDSFFLVENLTDPENPELGPYVERYFWFQFVDFSEVDLWGLYTQGYTREKPAYEAFLNLTDTGPPPEIEPVDPGENPPLWDEVDDDALPVQVSGADLLEGRLPEATLAGGFHPENVGGLDLLTNGVFDGNGLSLILQDYGFPALHIRYRFDVPMAISEARFFAGHFGSSGNRAFQTHAIRVNGQDVPGLLTTGNFGQTTGGDTAVSLVRWLPGGGAEHVARNVETIEFLMYCASSLDLDYRDPFSPLIDPGLDTDGTDRAYVAPIMKEIDLFGVAESTLATSTEWSLY